MVYNVNTTVQVGKTYYFYGTACIINIFMGSIMSLNQYENHKLILHTWPLKTSGNITQDHHARWISSSVVAALTLSVNTAPSALTWLLFSARSVSTSSLRLKGFPTSTVILCGHRQELWGWRQVMWPTWSEQRYTLPYLPCLFEGCRASCWAERQSDLRSSRTVV